MTTLRLALPNEILADINNTRKAHGIFSALMHTLKIIKGHLFWARDAILFACSLEDALPAFRRQGIQTVLHQKMFQLLRERGYKRVLILVGLDNHPSLQMHSRLYQAIGRLTRIKVFRLMYLRYSPEIAGEARHIIKWLRM